MLYNKSSFLPRTVGRGCMFDFLFLIALTIGKEQTEIKRRRYLEGLGIKGIRLFLSEEGK
jgi:hypothetical protein